MKTSNLYHFEIGIPKIVPLRFGKMELKYSYHAQREASYDRYGEIDLPAHINTDEAHVIEVEVVHDGLVEKILYRVHLDAKRDLVLAVIPYRGFVKTVWVNLKSDKHKTLDRSKYVKPKDA